MKMDEKKTGSVCLVCGGEIVERFHYQAVFTGNPKIIGPGGRRFSHYAENETHDGYHCRLCGNEYHKLPPKDLLKAKAEQ